MPHEIRLLGAGDRVTGLSLGDAVFTPLKTYLQKHAKNHQQVSLDRTYIVLDVPAQAPPAGAPAPKPLGYMTLVAGEVAIEAADDGLVDDDADEVQYPYLQYPAVKIARLAVDQNARGRGIGTDLVDLALGLTRDEVAAAVGCRFLMVDAKKDSVSFYDKAGFTMLDTEANRAREEKVMFIDVFKVAE